MPALDYDYGYLASYRPDNKYNNKLEVYRKKQSQKEYAYRKTSKKTKEQVMRFMQESTYETRTMPRRNKSIKAREVREAEPEINNEVEPEEIVEVKKNVNSEKLISVKNIPIFLLIATVALFICYRYSIINEKFNSVEKVKKELLNAQTVNDQLQADIDSETDISYVENYAKYQLGMQKPQDSQIIYLDVENEDRIFTSVDTDVEEESSWLNKIMQKIAEIF